MTHPGEIILNEFLIPLGMSQVARAHKMDVPIGRVNTLIKGKRDMSAETAILLSKVLNTSSEFWMSLHVTRDLFKARQKIEEAA